MDPTEIVAVISGVINLIGVVAGLFGWRRHKRAKETVVRVQRTGEAVIQGIEACEALLETEEAKQVKRSVHAAAEAAGVEDDLHRWLVDLGLAQDSDQSSVISDP